MLRKKLAAAAAVSLALMMAATTAVSADSTKEQTVSVNATGRGTVVFKASYDTTVRTNIPDNETFIVSNHTVDREDQYFGIVVRSTAPQTYTVSGDIADVRFCPVGGRAVQSGKTYNVGDDLDSDDPYDFTFKAPADGYITVSPRPFDDEILYFDTQLVSGGRKLSGVDEFDGASSAIGGRHRAYGVRKGKTYTIRTKTSTTSSPVFAYKFRYDFHPVSCTGGTSKGRAKTMKARRQYRGTLAAGSSTSRWYRIKAKKSSPLYFSYHGDTNSRIDIELMHRHGSVTDKYNCFISPYLAKSGTSLTRKYGSHTKGTWYVRVRRHDKGSSGYYSIRWRQR